MLNLVHFFLAERAKIEQPLYHKLILLLSAWPEMSNPKFGHTYTNMYKEQTVVG